MSQRVVICDDDLHVVVPLQIKFTEAGYDAVIAHDGEEAWQEIQACTPDLLVTDLCMPEMDGFELVRRLRSYPPTRHVPVILLTAVPLETATREVIAELDITEVMPKPYSAKAALRAAERVTGAVGA
jgi:CheY-like chemotaxis protein